MNPMGQPLQLSGSGGSAGPSSSSGMFGSTSWGGMDNSGWTINNGAGFGHPGAVASNQPSVAMPAAVGFTSDQFGLPNMVLGTPAAAAASTQAMGVSPLLIVAALVVVLALRHRK